MTITTSLSFNFCFVLSLLFAATLPSCKTNAPTGPGYPKVVKSSCNKIFKQGIKGQVLYLEGNHMPGPDGDYVFPTKKVKRILGVFAPTPVNKTTNAGDMTFFTDIQTKCLYLIQTDKNGCFSYYLPDGKYSIMVWEEEQWYANSFDGENIISPVVVEKGKVTDLDIKINHKAVY